MKNLPLILSSLALIGVGLLFFKGNMSKKTSTIKVQNDSTGVEEEIELTRIAYIDIDSLEANYGYFKKKKAEFTARGKRIENELESKAKSLENSYIALQKKAQAGSLTQAEGEKEQKSLISRQENLEKLRDNLGSQLMKDQDAFNKSYREKLEKVVAEYNNDNQYDFILIDSKGGSFLYSNPTLDITEDIVVLLNKSKE
jgi:outer membrane protein